jgi:hypothetical protein
MSALTVVRAGGSQLFAPDPARDGRFVVKARWIECDNLPGAHPLHSVQFFHRQMNEEVDSLEASAQALADFPNAPWELRLALARQCSDEARHARAYRAQVERRGGHVGQFPVLNFQYRIITAQAGWTRSHSASARRAREASMSWPISTRHSSQMKSLMFALRIPGSARRSRTTRVRHCALVPP